MAADKDVPPQHEPYVPASQSPAEFTWSAVVMGSVLGIVFGASSLYLVLKVGMTVSASIPVAVISVTLFRGMSRLFGIRPATILENNIVQTAGSAGESLAFGVGVTMPAVMLLGFDMSILRVMVVSVLGGLLGILMMIPLRRAFIVEQHGRLTYPEGTACADVLIVGEEGGSSAKAVFAGFGVAFVYQFLGQGLRLFTDTVGYALSWYKNATLSMELNPTLLGVGYIIGTRTSCIMVAGGMLAYLVLMPAIHFFGDGLSAPLEPATTLIRDMNDGELRNAFVLYIGAGAVAAGGIISLLRALPMIVGSIAAGVGDVRRGRAAATEGDSEAAVPRTNRDLSMRVVLFGSLLLILGIWASLPLHGGVLWISLLINLLAAALIILFGFLFVTVSSRLTGEIGSSSNPISGMTVATLLLTCLIFLLLGLTAPAQRLTALTIAAIVCVASSNGGTTSQDLKTGYLVGATPRAQQLAIVVGSVSSALVIGWILMLLNDANTVYHRLDAQQVAPLQAEANPDRAAPPAAVAPAALTAAALAELPVVEGPDGHDYWSWHARAGNAAGIAPGKYLVDRDGRLCYLVDPAINGVLEKRDDGTPVQRFDAPKTRLMAIITEGILNQKLPWILVLLGVCIALVLELSGVSSLPFAVGVYLPLSASTPIFLGGLVRWLVERRRPAAAAAAESEMSPGTLLSTGYIAGGTIAGVIVALFALSDRAAGLLRSLQLPAYDGFGFVGLLGMAVLLLLVGVRGNRGDAKAARAAKKGASS